ncbi:hypothetical protein [Paenibacillus sp. OSY-SE]|uniref:hypothetical protein n=1 Tax=Paenibacillus sp. OSY-SE TaxID=1196323 RepID=UPI0003078EC3|nr:hypothetical protein [Paenibacillus sp. OSY-SE]
MAKFGDVLLQPESGWKRYDDSEPIILYEGDGWERYSNGAYYNGARQACSRTSIKPKIKFNFIGSKLILISSLYLSYSNKIEIKIDEKIYEASQVSNSTYNQAVFFIIEGLKFKEHSVEITKINQGGWESDFNLDAIDIDESGQLKPYAPREHKYLIHLNSGQYLSLENQMATATAIPQMTSNTTPSGRAFAKDIYSAPYDAWKAFNQTDDNDGYCSQNGSAGVGFLGYEFTHDIPIFKYTLRSMNSSAALHTMPKDWTFEGSFNGDKWFVLDTQKNQTWTATNTDKDYYITNPKSYKMYRLNWTANNGYTGYTGINELKMYIGSNSVTHVPTLNEKYFIAYGMDKITQESLKSNYDQVQLISNRERKLMKGKTFEHEIDLKKYEVNRVLFRN